MDLGAFQKRFRGLYGSEPAIFRAPGRVNLIGEHTDYNDGFVMPAALPFETWVGVAKRSDNKLRVRSVHFEEEVEFSLAALVGPPTHHWSDYVRGVGSMLHSVQPLTGANLLIESDVPLGAGLSSSAAIELSTALALTWAAGIAIDYLDLVRLCQRVEHEFAGTHCGIMDQFIARFGRADHALLLDCRSLACEPVPIPSEVRIVICNSMVRHALASSEYNRRRRDCEEGVRELHKVLPEIKALRDVSCEDLERHREKLQPQVYRRCRHVVSENERTKQAAAALRNNNPDAFGNLMYESHRSLRDDYEVSCAALDTLVDLARSFDGVYGARMTGGGFGGCTVNLVAAGAVKSFRKHIASEYEKATGIAPIIYVCSAADGAGRLA